MVRGKKEKTPRDKETRSLYQWLDDCPETRSLKGIVVKRKNPLCDGTIVWLDL